MRCGLRKTSTCELHRLADDRRNNRRSSWAELRGILVVVALVSRRRVPSAAAWDRQVHTLHLHAERLRAPERAPVRLAGVDVGTWMRWFIVRRPRLINDRFSGRWRLAGERALLVRFTVEEDVRRRSRGPRARSEPSACSATNTSTSRSATRASHR
jgi:hypothetical protein